jgi:hypothetical protein
LCKLEICLAISAFVALGRKDRPVQSRARTQDARASASAAAQEASEQTAFLDSPNLRQRHTVHERRIIAASCAGPAALHSSARREHIYWTYSNFHDFGRSFNSIPPRDHDGRRSFPCVLDGTTVFETERERARSAILVLCEDWRALLEAFKRWRYLS